MDTDNLIFEASEYFVGNDLSGVVFVRDYIQLQFNPPPIISAFTPVSVHAGDNSATQGSKDFANMLIGQVNKVVRELIYVPGGYLGFCFIDGSEIHLSLRSSDYVGPEAVTLKLPGEGCVVL